MTSPAPTPVVAPAPTTPVLVRVATAISGVLGVVLPNIGLFHLPVATQATITSIGGGLLMILAFLEHPTVSAAANKIASK